MARLRLPIVRVAGAVALALLATTASAAPRSEDVTLRTAQATLSGTLELPATPGPVPVALLIAGSGATDRDGNGIGTQARPDTLKLLAAALALAGFASVRYDKRGQAASASPPIQESELKFEDYAEDAAAWVARLATDPRFSGVAVVGHSEGSLVGMLAARQGHVRAFVSLAGPGRGAADVLRTQLQGKLPPGLAERNEAILQALQRGEPVADVPPQLAFLYRPSVQPYLISYFRYVPARVLAGLGLPCLVAQGDSDIQEAVGEAEALHAAVPRAELLIVPGMGHTLKLVPPGPQGQQQTYLDPSLPLAPALTQALVAFLARTMTPASNPPKP